MKPARKYIAYLLVFVMPLSAWASAGAPCAQVNATAIAAQIATQTVTVDSMHAHHQGADTSASRTTTGHANHTATDADSMPADCPCCDDCASACVLSSCGLVAMSTASCLTAFNGIDVHFPDADAFREGPPKHVLFRPPIFSV